MYKLKLWISALAVCATPLAAQTQSVDQFAGSWVGGGRFQGQPSVVEAQFAPVLSGNAWDLNIVIRDASDDERIFEGRATYVMSEEAGEGVWVDSAHNAYMLEPRLSAGELVVGWGNDTMRGRSRYRIVGAELEIVDEVLADGDWRTFSTSVLSRVN